MPVQKEFIRKKDLPDMAIVTNVPILFDIYFLHFLFPGSCSSAGKTPLNAGVPILTQDELNFHSTEYRATGFEI